jgi:BirA family biotin operon repressor/biotin-[acetyl-CoA-carboxylase] ligase
LLAPLADQFSRWLAVWGDGEGFSDIRKAWIERAGPISERIRVNSVDGPISGRYQGLSDSGALLMDVDGDIREINHGDVALGISAVENGDA